jgi:hypothetical protein
VDPGPDDLASPPIVEVFLYTRTQGDDLFSSCPRSRHKRASAKNSPMSGGERVLTLFVDALGDPFVFTEIDQGFYQCSRFYGGSPHCVVRLSHLSLRKMSVAGLDSPELEKEVEKKGTHIRLPGSEFSLCLCICFDEVPNPFHLGQVHLSRLERESGKFARLGDSERGRQGRQEFEEELHQSGRPVQV